MGDGVIDLLRRAFAAGGSREVPDESTVMEFKQHFKQDCDYHVAPYDGIEAVLNYCAEHGILLACNTNKPHENALKVIHTHFADSFDMVQGNESGLPKKPDPAGVNKILESFNILPQEAVYIGDSNVDIFTAKAAGMRSIGAAWGYRGKAELTASGADEIALEPMDILKFIAV